MSKVRYKIEDSKVVHDDKNCSYLAKTGEKEIVRTTSKGYDKCPRCTEKGR